MPVVGVCNAVALVEIIVERVERFIPRISEDYYIILPTQRLCRALDVALRQEGTSMIMPKIVSFHALDTLLPLYMREELPSVLLPTTGQLLLQPLIEAFQKKERITFGALTTLSLKLYHKFEDCLRSGVPFEKLALLDSDMMAAHRQKTVAFLNMMATHWPKILEEHKVVTPALYQKIVVEQLLEHWPSKSSMQAIAAIDVRRDVTLDPLLLHIASMNNGTLFLPGFSSRIPEDTHALSPQRGFHALLQKNKLNIQSIERNTQREVSFQQCSTFNEEAHTIATAARVALDEHNIVHIVSPSRDLARRVLGVLSYWGIDADDSGGEPFLETPLGRLWKLSGDWITLPTLEATLSLLKHPWISLSQSSHGTLREISRAFERSFRTKDIGTIIPWTKWKCDDSRIDAFHDIVQNMDQAVAKVRRTVQKGGMLQDIVLQHQSFIIFLCGSLYPKANESVQQASNFLDAIQAAPNILIPSGEYVDQIVKILQNYQVRIPKSTNQKRVRILGVLEARFVKADYLIIGGMNEDVWPNIPIQDPWMTSKMAEKIGMPSAEDALCIFLYDFRVLLDNPNVLITDGACVHGKLATPSRFVSMFLKGKTEGKHAAFKTFLTQSPVDILPCAPPAPTPKISIRPRTFSVTDIETLLFNPYAIYVQKILKLRSLNRLNQSFDERIFGILVHKILQIWQPTFYHTSNAEVRLNLGKKIAEVYLTQYITTPLEQSIARHRIFRILRWFLMVQERLQPDLVKSWVEVPGCITLDLPNGRISIRGVIDRIDLYVNGVHEIIDYKTGSLPRLADVESGLSNQLSLEALIASEDLSIQEIGALSYWQVSGHNIAGQKKTVVSSANAILGAVRSGLENIFTTFDKSETAYYARPYGGGGMDASDHLSRLQEWVDG